MGGYGSGMGGYGSGMGGDGSGMGGYGSGMGGYGSGMGMDKEMNEGDKMMMMMKLQKYCFQPSQDTQAMCAADEDMNGSGYGSGQQGSGYGSGQQGSGYGSGQQGSGNASGSGSIDASRNINGQLGAGKY